MSLAKKYCTKKMLVSGLTSLSLLLGPVVASAEGSALWNKKHLVFADSELKDAGTAVLSDGKDGSVKNLVVFTSNDAALNGKIDIIKKAGSKGRNGDSLDLVYFIFDKDETSSIMANELIKAAKRGVKVRLLTDLHTNYKNLDYFNMLQRESGQNLEVSFYNRPSNSVVLSATYLTTSCSPENMNAEPESSLFLTGTSPCADEKLAKLDELYVNTERDERKPEHFVPKTDRAKAFISGLYSKDAEVLGSAIMEGQGVDPEKLLAGDPNAAASDPQATENVKWFMKLVYDSKFSSSVFTKISSNFQLWASLVWSKEARKFYNKLTGVLPLLTTNSEAYAMVAQNRSGDFKHLTDYTHHKLLMLTGQKDQEIQLGGRNIQNSYHLSDAKESFTHKYLFMDTDAKITLREKNQKMKDNFNKLWDHTMVIRLDEVMKQFDNSQLETLKAIMAYCKEKGISEVVPRVKDGNITSEEAELMGLAKQDTEKYNKQCKDYSVSKDVNEAMLKPLVKEAVKKCYSDLKAGVASQGYSDINSDYSGSSEYSEVAKNISNMSLNDRLDKARSEMEQMMKKFGSLEKNKAPNFSLKNDKSAIVTYIENVPFNEKIMKKAVNQRLYGSKPDKDLNYSKYGKHIHESLLKGMRNVCARATSELNKQRIILHNAYFAPAANTLEVFGRMVDGTWDCSNVTVDIITNSMETTDLAAVNIFSRHSMKAFFDYASLRSNQFSAKFNLYEYNKVSSGKNKSLHSKVSVLGSEDMIIGSANLDIRSYMMDTNNGIYIRRARNMVEQYSNFVQGLIDSGRVKLVNNFYVENSIDDIRKDDQKKIECDAKRYGVDKFMKLNTLMGAIFDLSKSIASTNELAHKSLSKYRTLNSDEVYTGVLDPMEEHSTVWNPELDGGKGDFETIDKKGTQEESQSEYDDMLKVI